MNEINTEEKKAPYSAKPGEPNIQYGWKYDPATERIIEVPVEQANIARAKELKAQRLSLSKIGEVLAKEERTRRGGSMKWDKECIWQLTSSDGLRPAGLRRQAMLDAAADARLAAEEAARLASRVPFDEPDPVKWGEAYLLHRDGSPRSYWTHQTEDLRAEEANIIHLDGRDVGKTADLSTLALHYALTTPKGSGLIAAALTGQLLAILEEIECQIESNARLQDHMTLGKSGHWKLQRSPYPRIAFANGSVLYFRPAGAYGEAFRSLHVERIWVDEGAWLSEEAWRALRQCLKSGGKMRVYSTPNGVRNTTYYRLTQSARWRVFRWPSWLNPTWDKDREADLLEFYGGKSSAGWQHEVAGEHGAPSYGAFSAEAFARCLEMVPEYRKVVIAGEDLGAGAGEEEMALTLDGLLGLAPRRGVFWIGADLGYTCDPTEILVFEESDRSESSNPSENPASILRLILRVHMKSVGYPQIGQCLAILDMMLSPLGIGVDNGGNGLAVVQELMSLDKYRDHGFDGRLIGFDFGGVTSFELPNGMEARKRTKELMTSLINGALQRREIAFPIDDKGIEDQFLTQTYSMNNGIVVYSKGNDHIIDAARCMMLAREKLRPEGLLGDRDDRTPILTPRIEFFRIGRPTDGWLW